MYKLCLNIIYKSDFCEIIDGLSALVEFNYNKVFLEGIVFFSFVDQKKFFHLLTTSLLRCITFTQYISFPLILNYLFPATFS